MVDVKKEYERYDSIMPMKEANINGEVFPYRFYKNPQPNKDVTLVFLAGGTGLADAAFLLFGSFIDRYHLLTFNYPQAFQTNASLADAVAALLIQLNVHNVYLVGQSYGGLFAQVMAKLHPEAVKGLILSSTCSMYNDLTYTGITDIVKFMNPRKLKRNLRIDKLLPTRLLPPILKLVFKKVVRDKTIVHNIADIIDLLKESITNSYWYHMDLLLGDLMNEYGTHKPEDFAGYQNEVLIIFSKEDKIFSDELKDALVRLMPQPNVISDIQGGHLALIINPEVYVNEINLFISERN